MCASSLSHILCSCLPFLGTGKRLGISNWLSRGLDGLLLVLVLRVGVVLVLLQRLVDLTECLVDVRLLFGARKDNFARDEDEEHNFGVKHPVDKAGKELWLIAAVCRMAHCQPLQTDGKFHVARPHYVLDFELLEMCVETELLDDARELARCKPGAFLALGACTHHLARREDEGRGLGLSDAHDDGREALGVVFGVASVQRNLLQIELASQVHRRDDVPMREQREHVTQRTQQGRARAQSRPRASD